MGQNDPCFRLIYSVWHGIFNCTRTCLVTMFDIPLFGVAKRERDREREYTLMMVAELVGRDVRPLPK